MRRSRRRSTARLHGPAIELDAPYVAEMARAEMVERFGAGALIDGYRVYTTVDSRLQRLRRRAGAARDPRVRAPPRLPRAAREIDSSSVADDAAVAGRVRRARRPRRARGRRVVESVAEQSAVVRLRDARRVELRWEDCRGHGARCRGHARPGAEGRGARCWRAGSSSTSSRGDDTGGSRSSRRSLARWLRSIRTTARSSRWPVVSTSSTASTTARCRRTASRLRVQALPLFRGAGARFHARHADQRCADRDRGRRRPRRSGGRRTSPSASTDRRRCARRSCARATWCRSGAARHWASASRSSTSATSVSARGAARQPDAGARHRQVTPLEMARGFAVFANGGYRVEPTPSSA